MKNYNPNNDWLANIEYEILKKYKIHKPTFIYNFKHFDSRNKIIDWIIKVSMEDRWIKYKVLNNNIIELKDFSPCPQEKWCKKEAEEWGHIENFAEKKHGIRQFVIKIGCLVYNPKEAIKEILFELREGIDVSAIDKSYVTKSTNGTNIVIIEPCFVWGLDEFYHEIQKGRLELENKFGEKSESN